MCVDKKRERNKILRVKNKIRIIGECPHAFKTEGVREEVVAD